VLNGDLSNKVVPRLCLVFEGALGFLPPGRLTEFNRTVSRSGWYAGWLLWDLNDLMCRKIWDVTYRQSFQLEIVTYVPPDDVAAEAAQGLAQALDDEGLPISRVVASTPARMARRLAYAPDIACVYDADPQHAFTYGGKGKLLRSVHELGRF
jgi:hypothetical protein